MFKASLRKGKKPLKICEKNLKILLSDITFFLFLFWLVCTHGFELANQELYCLSHTPGHFALVILEMRSRELFFWLASSFDPPNLSLLSS
jgi:hypothetical protein